MSTTAFADTLNLDPPKWKKLIYVTSILFFSAESNIEFKNVSPSTITTQVVDSKYGKPVTPRANSVSQIVLTSSFLGKNSNISLFFEPNLNSLQRTQLDSGKKNRYKVYQYLDTGVYSLRLNPKSGEQQRPYSQWTDKGVAHFQYPEGFDLNQPIIDPTSLFYILSAGLFKKPGDKATFTAFVKNRILKLKLVAEDITELEVDYLEMRAGRKEYVEDEVKVLRVTLDPLPFDVGNSAINTDNNADNNADFEFLGLKGNLEFFIDTKKYLLVQLSGKVDVIGVVDIVLNEVEFE